MAFLASCIVVLFLPGMAVLHRLHADWSPDIKFSVAPAVTMIWLALAGILGWIFPNAFWNISAIAVLLPTVAALIFLLASPSGRRTIRSIDPILPVAYIILVIFASQFVKLPARVPAELFDQFPYEYFYLVKKDRIPVRIQAIFHNLPVDNLIAYRFADFMRRGVDFRTPREAGCGDRPAIVPGQFINARTPLMALVSVHAGVLASPPVPVDGRWKKTADYDDDDYYRPFLCAAMCLNALVILPTYLLGVALGGRCAGRLAALLAAVNLGLLVHTAFIWPKAVAAYFVCLLLSYFATNWRRSPWSPWVVGSLSSLAYFAHPCVAGATVGCMGWQLLQAPERRLTLRRLLVAGGITACCVAPWVAWGVAWLGTSGNLVSQNIGALGGIDAVVIRLSNILRTLWPHELFDSNRSWSDRVFAASFFTFPGMLGLTLVPWLALSMRNRKIALLVSCVLGAAVVITALPFGGLHDGLMPFGGFLALPVSLAAAAAGITTSGPLRFLVLVCLLEQMAGVWFVYSAQAGWTSKVYVSDHQEAWCRLAFLLAVQGTAIIVTVYSLLWRRVSTADATLTISAGTD